MTEAPTFLKPDKLNGERVLRPVQDGSVQRGAFFPPTVAAHVPKEPLPIEQLIDATAEKFDHMRPFKKQLGGAMVRAALNERAQIIRHLKALGLTDAVKALEHG